MARDFNLPPITEVPVTVRVVSVPVHVGDFLLKDHTYLTIATDKIDLDIPAPFDCIVTNIHVAVNDEIQQGAAVLTVDPRGDGPEIWESREGRTNVKTGLLYLSTREVHLVCCRDSLGQYKFEDLEPFVDAIITQSRILWNANLDSVDEAAIVGLRDTLYLITTHVIGMESFKATGATSAADHAFILRSVAQSQDVLVRRLLTAVAQVEGKAINASEDIRSVSAVYNPSRAYVL